MRFLVVGASVIDMFASISDEKRASITDHTVTLHLGDKVPINLKTFALGGNGMNVSVGLSRLGIQTTFYTYLGDDRLSTEIESSLKKEGVEILIERSKGASSISFILDFATDRIIFSHHPTRNHGFSPPHGTQFDYVFLSSIGTHWEEAYTGVIDFIERSGCKLIFSPGSKQLEDCNDVFFTALHKSCMILVNKEEALHILKQFGVTASTPKEILTEMAKLGPETISITDGANGAFARNAEGEMYTIPTIVETSALEKTGAGDAYAAAFLAGMCKGVPIAESMRWGILSSHAVMQKTGAQNGLLKPDNLESLQKLKPLVAKPLE